MGNMAGVARRNSEGSDRGNRGTPRRGRDLQYALSGDEGRPYFPSDDRLDFFFFFFSLVLLSFFLVFFMY